jgi:hypothetical protein
MKKMEAHVSLVTKHQFDSASKDQIIRIGLTPSLPTVHS